MRASGDKLGGVYPTPDWLYWPLRRLMPFSLDVAATAQNTKCRRFFSPHDDGLAQSWAARWWWGNVPYGQKPGTDAWVWKARAEVDRLGNSGCLLLPVKAETEWYQHGVWGLNRVVDSGRLEAGRIRGRWYQLREPRYFVEVLELETRVPFLEKPTASGHTSGWFASAVVVLNAPKRALLPQLADVSNRRQRAA